MPLSLNKTIFYVETIPYKLGSTKGILAICFNKRKEIDFRETRHCEIKNAEKLLSRGKKIKSGLEIYFDKKGKIINSVIEDNEQFDSFSCIFTTKKISKEEMIRLYFDKDVVEKAFR